MQNSERFSNEGIVDATQWDSLANCESRSEKLLTPEQKRTELSFERISKLSTDEYIELWRRLNPFLLPILG